MSKLIRENYKAYASSDTEVISEVESFTRVDQEDRHSLLDPGMQKWLLDRMNFRDRRSFSDQYNAIMREERLGLRKLRPTLAVLIILGVAFLLINLPFFSKILFS